MAAQNSPIIDYTKIINDLASRQLALFGPDITFALVRKIDGLIVDQNGKIKVTSQNAAEALNNLASEFLDLSSLIVKKTVESLMQTYPGLRINADSRSTTKKNTLLSRPLSPISTKESTQTKVVTTDSIEEVKEKTPVEIPKVGDYSSVDGMQEQNVKHLTDLFHNASGHKSPQTT